MANRGNKQHITAVFDFTKNLLDTMALTQALWWFIENVNDDTPYRTDLFFYLRERVRAEGLK